MSTKTNEKRPMGVSAPETSGEMRSAAPLLLLFAIPLLLLIIGHVIDLPSIIRGWF